MYNQSEITFEHSDTGDAIATFSLKEFVHTEPT